MTFSPWEELICVVLLYPHIPLYYSAVNLELLLHCPVTGFRPCWRSGVVFAPDFAVFTALRISLVALRVTLNKQVV